jgi:hypothetical protein
MNHIDKINAILFIKPNAKFALRGDDLEWFDQKQTQPTNEEIEAGFIAYKEAQKIEAKATAEAKSALLERLGITEDEAKLLFA